MCEMGMTTEPLSAKLSDLFPWFAFLFWFRFGFSLSPLLVLFRVWKQAMEKVPPG